MPQHQKRPDNQMAEIIQFRISARDKENLLKAASLSGLKYTTYARQRLMNDVHRDLKSIDENRFILGEEAWDKFLEVLEAPADVPPKLKSAQAKFKKKYAK